MQAKIEVQQQSALAKNGDRADIAELQELMAGIAGVVHNASLAESEIITKSLVSWMWQIVALFLVNACKKNCFFGIFASPHSVQPIW